MYQGAVRLCAPASCFDEARRHAPAVARKQHQDSEKILSAIDDFRLLIEPVEMSVLAPFEEAARLRIARDLSDWPVIALAMATGFPIWTQDQDFFGCGIATWTTDRVQIYLR
jgi:predicted nucleic acid-binding protein